MGQVTRLAPERGKRGSLRVNVVKLIAATLAAAFLLAAVLIIGGAMLAVVAIGAGVVDASMKSRAPQQGG